MSVQIFLESILRTGAVVFVVPCSGEEGNDFENRFAANTSRVEGLVVPLGASEKFKGTGGLYPILLLLGVNTRYDAAGETASLDRTDCEDDDAEDGVVVVRDSKLLGTLAQTSTSR